MRLTEKLEPYIDFNDIFTLYAQRDTVRATRAVWKNHRNIYGSNFSVNRIDALRYRAASVWKDLKSEEW